MYALIGAGPMGLAAARNLSRYGIPFVGFELHSDVGGLWDIENPQSTVYESAHLISSKTTTEFAEFPMRPETAPYPHQAEMREYFREYADHFDLRRHFRFETRVERAERAKDGNGWLITSVDLTGDRQTERFRGLLIATGTLHHPNIPTLPGEFRGEIFHSALYKRAAQLEGKRILIVGCGNSGADIAVEAVHHAASVDISLRRGYYFVPKFIRGRPVDTLGGRLRLPRRIRQWFDAALLRVVVGRPSDYGLPDPDYALYESHPVLNTLILHHLGQGDITPRRDLTRIEGDEVWFADGSSGTYDLIILATGYALHYPFLDRAELNWPADAAAPRLYLNAFHPMRDDLFVLGMVEAAGLGWEGRNEQAELVALYLLNHLRGTGAAQEFERRKLELASARIDGGYNYLELERMAYYVHKESYLRAVRQETRRLRRGISR